MMASPLLPLLGYKGKIASPDDNVPEGIVEVETGQM
jgi:hypothetical protein